MSSAGNQIFITLRKGREPRTVDVRIRYEQTVGELKAAAARKLGLAPDQMLLFHHGRELTAAHDGKTLLQMNMHTGFGLSGYDLTAPPEFWPPVEEGPEGKRVVGADVAT